MILLLQKKIKKKEIVVSIKEKSWRALYTHYYAHFLNLVVGNTMNTLSLEGRYWNYIRINQTRKNMLKRDIKLCSLQKGPYKEGEFDNFVKLPKVTLFCPTW